MSPARVRVILQTRVTSSRLPGKAMLTLAGMPVFVLAAKRAGNRGHDVVVATSDQDEDDIIVDAAERFGLRVSRGSLDDTLARFVVASSDLGARDVLVRLTADNVVPDGTLVEAVVEAFHRGGDVYTDVSAAFDGVPYGVSAEVFTVGDLRRASASASNAFDREHVTPWIRRLAGPIDASVPSAHRGRCTIDTLDDYLTAAQVFAELSEPTEASWNTLADRFTARTANASLPRAADGLASELILGTAQLGSRYGIANSAGMPSRGEAERLLRSAVALGVSHVDTAAAYSESEIRIGGFLRRGYRDRLAVITKVSPLRSARCPGEAVRASVYRSIASLGAPIDADRNPSLDTVLLHRAVDADTAGGEAWDELRRMRDEGLVGTIGVSVQNPGELERVLELEDIAMVQLPFNLLDRRWDYLAAHLRDSDTIVVARSVFLQGLLSGRAPTRGWPARRHVDTDALWERLLSAADSEHVDVPGLALSFARAQPWIDRVVIGCETEHQLLDLRRRFNSSPMSSATAAAIAAEFGGLPDELVDPSKWGVDSRRGEPGGDGSV